MSFSCRNNFLRAVPIQVKNDAPVDFRVYLFKALQNYVAYEAQQKEWVFVSLEQVPPPQTTIPIKQEVWRALAGAEWFRVYDVVEALYRKLSLEKPGKVVVTPQASEFRKLTNAYFEREGYGYRLNDMGHIEARGDEAFEAAIDNADIALSSIGASTAKAEIHKALEDLARRPDPDLTGAVQHAMAGLECVANQVVGVSGYELGKIVKSHPERFPQPLSDIVPKLYGYASNNGRHVTEGQEPEFAEAELIVGIAATVSTYLARKAN